MERETAHQNITSSHVWKFGLAGDGKSAGRGQLHFGNSFKGGCMTAVQIALLCAGALIVGFILWVMLSLGNDTERDSNRGTEDDP